MNQLVHSCFRTTSTPSHLMARIFMNLDEYLKAARPTKSLVLAFDGPAPFAKIQTQRNRRISTPESSLVTPGTDFMNSMVLILSFPLSSPHSFLFSPFSLFLVILPDVPSSMP